MAFLDIRNVKLAGISVAIPKKIEKNINFFKDEEKYAGFLSTTGIECRRKVENSVCASDLCQVAAEKLISELNWDKSEIDALVFVSQTPDYITPATSCVLQEKIGLSENCYCIDINLGCSGWVYALSVIASLLQTGCMKKGILLAGDTVSKFCSEEDKSTYPLFGDAGTATAIEFSEPAPGMKFSFNTDGNGADAIIIKDGAYRNPVTIGSLEMKESGDGIISNNLQLKLDGMNVFSFGISKAPSSVNGLIEKYEIDKDVVDYFIFHQANLFMNEKIRKKLKLSSDKTPYCLKDFGNTSCASIPLTMVSQMQCELQHKSLKHIACGFGVGLSWGSVYFETDNIVVPSIIEL